MVLGPSWQFSSPAPQCLSGEPGEWVWVQSSLTPQPFQMRVAQRSGRFRVIGLAVDNGKEVTADLLRSIKLGAALEEFLGDEGWYGQADDDVEAGSDADLHRRAFGHLVQHMPQLESKPPRVRRGTPPSDEELQHFARVYSEALAKHPRRAMTIATDKDHIPMARSTGYRWRAMCRERGYLPQEEA